MRLNYIIIPFIVTSVAAIGSLITTAGIEWYEKIKLPDWTPSGKFISAIWTFLFFLTALSILIVWNRAPHNNKFWWIIAIFILNGALNIFWSYLFFNQHLIGSAVIEAGLFSLSILALIVLIWSFGFVQNKSILYLASLLLLPYFFWVSFTTYLTHTIWNLNK